MAISTIGGSSSSGGSSSVAAPLAKTGYAMLAHGLANTGKYVVPSMPSGKYYLAGNNNSRLIKADGSDIYTGYYDYDYPSYFTISSTLTNPVVTHSEWGPASSGPMSNATWVGMLGGYLFVATSDAKLYKGTSQTDLVLLGSTPVNFGSITYNGSNLYVALGTNSTVYTSPDAVTWTARSTSTSLTGTASSVLYDVAFGGTKFVMVGTAYSGGWGGYVWYSSDGITWTSVTNWWNQGAASVVKYNGSQFMLASGAMGGSAGSTYNNSIGYSADGVSWTWVNTYLPSDHLVWDGTYWWAVSRNFQVLMRITTTGSLTYTYPYSSLSYNNGGVGSVSSNYVQFKSIGYANGRLILNFQYVAGSIQPYFSMFSTDGGNTWKWCAATPPKYLVYAGNKYLGNGVVSTDLYGSKPINFQLAGDTVQTLN